MILKNYIVRSYNEATQREKHEDDNDDQTREGVDFGRIIFSPLGREIHDKTQVILLNSINQNDCLWTQRTRGSHSIEVYFTTDRICLKFSLNREYGKNLSMAHDLGHGPGGHALEDAVQSIFNTYDLKIKYDHDKETLRLANKIFKLNFTNILFDDIEARANRHKNDCMSEGKIVKIKTLEGAIVEIADKLDFVISDIEDGVHHKLLTREEMIEQPFLAKIIDYCEHNMLACNYKDDFKFMDIFKKTLYNTVRQSIYQNNEDLLAQIKEIKNKHGQDCFILTEENTFLCEDNIQELFENLIKWMYSDYYKSKMKQRDQKVKRCIKALFKILMEEPELIPLLNVYHIPQFDDEPIQVQIADILAATSERRLRKFFELYVVI